MLYLLCEARISYKNIKQSHSFEGSMLNMQNAIMV